ncbi:MAG: [acyl-carrier-protein] S-malonyltransferase [Verrucomicrobia bacterium]|nr:[acyl-carrier-protein] S-malonyltransferase [Verrucomicrobiota bacterium]
MKNISIVFAGQGAQSVGMGRDLAGAFPECRALFDRADAALGFSLSKVCFEGPIEELTKSNNCQPAIFVASMACFTALKKELGGSLEYNGMAGLSLGEWSALHAAGALSFDDAVRVLEARGRFMQQACEERQGGMVSVIGLPVDKLREVAMATGVEIANMNSEEQTVLSGAKNAIDEAAKAATAAGAKKTVVLNVAGAFHSSLMASAAGKLRDFLGSISFVQPSAPVVSNVTGRPHGSPQEIRENMVKQVTSPVQWVSCVKWFKENGTTRYVECGPGKVLSGLIRRIDKDAGLHDIQDVATLQKAVAAFKA